MADRTLPPVMPVRPTGPVGAPMPGIRFLPTLVADVLVRRVRLPLYASGVRAVVMLPEIIIRFKKIGE